MVSGGSQDVNLVAVDSGLGIVVVDTGASGEEGGAARVLIEAAFPGKRFAYVINTHSHWDHISGNSVFPEALVVAHRKCRDSIIRKGEGSGTESLDLPAASTPAEGLPAGENPDLPPPPPPVGTIWFEDGKYSLTIPDITFEDSLTLHCGDRTFRLVYFGETHTVSDIIVLVPEEKMLLVGDLFFNDWLPVFSEGIHPDPARWEQVRRIIDEDGGRIVTVIPGHGPLMDRAQLEKQFDYRLRLWDAVRLAAGEGRNLEEIEVELDLERMAPELVPWNIRDSRGRSVHEGNVRAVYRLLADPE